MNPFENPLMLGFWLIFIVFVGVFALGVGLRLDGHGVDLPPQQPVWSN
jgi:hypothetical protein